jgi:hypothetical protein
MPADQFDLLQHHVCHVAYTCPASWLCSLTSFSCAALDKKAGWQLAATDADAVQAQQLGQFLRASASGDVHTVSFGRLSDVSGHSGDQQPRPV